MPMGKAHGGHIRSAELLHKTVVPSAAAYGALRADALGYEFENGARIVIETANDVRIDRVRYACGVEAPLQLIHMCAAIAAQAVHGTRRVFAKVRGRTRSCSQARGADLRSAARGRSRRGNFRWPSGNR